MMKEKKLEEMIINDLASLKEDKDSVDEKICLRCWVPITEINDLYLSKLWLWQKK